MLQVPLNGSSQPPQVITRRNLRRLARRLDASQCAALAADLRSGRVQVSGMTEAQALALTGASSGYVHTAASLSDEDLAAVRRGDVGLSGTHNAPRNGPANLALTRAWDRATPQEQIKFIQHVGPESVWSALTQSL
jgi:hypothetical protein